MSFRKRNIGIGGSAASNSSLESGKATTSLSSHGQAPSPRAGVRPSPLDGRPTTSTGTQSLDVLLAGHAGLALGNSILLEESGTTEYASTLLRYYAAEGLVQGHKVHVIGVGEHWAKDLPGHVGDDNNTRNGAVKSVSDKDKMKIAWRYENLGEHGIRTTGSRGGRPSVLLSACFVHNSRDLRVMLPLVQINALTVTAPLPLDRSLSVSSPGPQQSPSPTFCHSFDLTKRLTLPKPPTISFIPVQSKETHTSPFVSIIQNLSQQVSSNTPETIHRCIFPALLSPVLYAPHASNPKYVLQFLHSLRSLLRQYPLQLTAMISLPLALYPRTTGLVRWIELLSDGVLELVPFPHSIDTGPSMTTSGAATAQEDKPQGMIKVHRLPVLHERGGGGIDTAGVSDDLAFTVSRKKFVIKPFSLPPVEGDTEAQKGDGEVVKTKIDVDF